MSESLQLSRKLPPSERDFDIYEAVHVAGYPTREQATKYGISQTRVRQIVRRVIEWLGEVIPPQAKIAKEQQSHLARQVAADRFNLQYAEASTNWYQSGELKFAGLRIRITHAQARLGVAGSLIGGLAADAIEGLPVPTYEPPPEPVGRAVPASGDRSAGEGSDEFPEIPDLEIAPTYPPDPVPFCEITEQVIATREAAGCPFPFKLIKALYEQGYLPTRESTPDSKLNIGLASPDPAHPPTEGLSASATPQSAIRNPHLPPPPLGDCSASTDNSAGRETDAIERPIVTNDAASTCDDNLAGPNDHCQRADSRSQPLLIDQDSMPVTALEITPNQPGAAITPAKESTLPPPVPCPPSPSNTCS